MRRILIFLFLISLTIPLTDAQILPPDLPGAEIIEAQASGTVVIDENDAYKTKGIRFNRDGTVLFKVSQGNDIDYKLNNQTIQFSNSLRWQFLGVRAGDVLTMTCHQYFEWMEYYYEDFKAISIMMLGILASVLSIFINTVQIVSHRNREKFLADEKYYKSMVEFTLSFFALFYTSVGTFFQSINIFSLSLAINLFNVNLLPIKSRTKLKIFGVVIAILSVVELIYLHTNSYLTILAMVKWNAGIGFLNLLYIMGYIIAFTLIRFGKLKKLHFVDRSYISVVFVATTLTLYAYFFKQEYVHLVSVSYSVYFAYKSIVSLVHSERNRNRAEQQSIEIEEKNLILHDLNQNLESLVLEKTKDIQSLLDHIPQGILSIDRDGKVMKDFSRVLPDILEVKDVAKQPFKSLLIDHSSNLSEDERDQFNSAIQSIVGESSLNFEVNSSKLAPLILYKNKWLSCTYSAILHGDLVEKINVTLLDISKEIESEASAELEKEKMVIVGELVNIKPQKSADFFESTTGLLQRIRSKVQAGLSAEDQGDIVAALHTIKGAARTYSFRKLSNILHNVEQYFIDSTTLGDATFSLPKAIQQIQRIEDTLLIYMDINVNLLGRNVSSDKVSVDKDFLKKSYAFLKDLILSHNFTPDIEGSLAKLKDDWLHLCSYTASDIILDSIANAASTASQLHKEVPEIAVTGDSVVVDDSQKSIIVNSFLHIIRNALDHGIETPEERTKAGKPRRGRILVHIEQHSNNFFQISVSDDGRGLDLETIRKKATEKGIAKPNDSLDQIADLIYSAGLSTATKLTEISGRGAGMDAVRRFCENAGGEARVELGDKKSPLASLYNFKIVLKLPLNIALNEPLNKVQSPGIKLPA